jgi:hypothetical protein
MLLARALLYLAAVALVVLAACGVPSRISLALLGAACFILAFALPDITAGFH